MPTVEELQLQVATLRAELDRRDSVLEAQRAMEADRAAANLKLKKIDLEADCLRIAHNTLMENKRSLPVGERNITAEELKQMKDALINSMSSLD